MQERTAKRLHDAMTAAQYIQQFIAGRNFQDYLNDVYFRSAVERQFEVLSESLKAAASHEPQLNDLFPELHAVVGLRNRIAHSYARRKDDLGRGHDRDTDALAPPGIRARGIWNP